MSDCPLKRATERDLPDVCAMLTLLQRHPKVHADDELDAAVDAIRNRVVDTWNALEAVCPSDG